MKSTQFQQIWRLRFIQKNRQALSLFEKISREEICDPKEEMDYLLLSCSFLRLEAKMEEANSLLAEIEARFHNLNTQYFVQKGIQSMCAAQYSLAMDCFIQAASLAHSDFEKVISEINLINVMECFGLENVSRIQSFQNFLERFDDVEMKQALNAEIIFLKAKAYFRNGQIAEILALPSLPFAQIWSFKLFVQALPYVSPLYALKPEDKNEFLTSEGLSYLKKSLCYTLTRDVRYKVKESEFTLRILFDRLYLWLWNWLMNPDLQNQTFLEEILDEVLSGCQNSQAFQRLTNEDLYLLKTSLRWLRALDPKFSRQTDSIWKKVQSLPLETIEFFEFERLLSQLFEEPKDKGKQRQIRAKLKKTAYFENPSFQWEAVIRKMKENFLKPKAKCANLIVVAERSEIFVGNKRMISQVLSQAIILLMRQSACSFELFSKEVFGVSTYDHEVHSSKIHNCLNRLRKVLPKACVIQTKDAKIYFSGLYSGIEIQTMTNQLNLRSLISKDFSSVREVKHKRSLHPRSLLKKSEGQVLLRRSEIQNMIGLSKASTNRWIQRWIENGQIKILNKGKATFYQIQSLQKE